MPILILAPDGTHRQGHYPLLVGKDMLNRRADLGTSLPRTVMRPFVMVTSSRICDIASQPAPTSAGLMNLVQISRSLRDFCPFIRLAQRMFGCICLGVIPLQTASVGLVAPDSSNPTNLVSLG